MYRGLRTTRMRLMDERRMGRWETRRASGCGGCVWLLSGWVCVRISTDTHAYTTQYTKNDICYAVCGGKIKIATLGWYCQPSGWIPSLHWRHSAIVHRAHRARLMVTMLITKSFKKGKEKQMNGFPFFLQACHCTFDTQGTYTIVIVIDNVKQTMYQCTHYGCASLIHHNTGH